jgi:hypothetical protein
VEAAIAKRKPVYNYAMSLEELQARITKIEKLIKERGQN